MARLGTDRPRLSRVDGLMFWRLLGTGAGTNTGPGIDPRRTALFAVWRDATDLDRFEDRMTARWDHLDESYHLRLRALSGHGTWRGFDVIGAGDHRRVPASPPGQPAADATLGPAHQSVPGRVPATTSATTPTSSESAATIGDAGPVAVLTRATVRLRHVRPFMTASRQISSELAGADGLLAVCGIGEAPIGRQATFSLWRSADDVARFAAGMPHHATAIRRTRAEGWYGEELFARFLPVAWRGTWDGRDPLDAFRNP